MARSAVRQKEPGTTSGRAIAIVMNFSLLEAATTSAAASLVHRRSLSVQVEELFHLFAWTGVEGPVLGVMVGINDGKDDALHVAGIGTREIGAVKEIEGEGFRSEER